MKKQLLLQMIDELRSELADLTKRHKALNEYVVTLRNDHNHLAEALAQRGVWDHDYSA
jgi:hypothetical protein